MLSFRVAEDLCNAPGKCVGGFLDEAIVDSLQECLEACKTFPGLDTNGDGEPDDFCAFFSYNADIGTCELLEDCQYLDGECAACTSGSAECSDTQEGNTLLDRLH